jgi:hypothetical protein
VEEHQSPQNVPLWIGIAAGVVVAIGAIGAIVALARGGNVAQSIAIAYYVAGCGVLLVGTFPSGGFTRFGSRRGRRSPVGGTGLALPSVLAGSLLIGLGVLFDVTHPF